MHSRPFEKEIFTMSTQIDGPFEDDSYFQDLLPKLYRNTLRQFHQILFSFFLFRISFFSLLFVEITLFTTLFPFYYHSAFLAFFLSGIFLTVFSYFALLLYFQMKKPEQFEQLKQKFLTACRKETEQHLSIAAATNALIARLEETEWLPSLKHQKITSLLFARSARQDLFRIRLLFLRATLNEQLAQARSTPTDLEAHASLANTYLHFSKLYGKNRSEQFCEASRLALEEFQIMNDYAPNDPWVHEQLAKGYRDLEMPKEELAITEHLVKLRPQESDLLFRLGTLYFEQGIHSKGLRVYEELKQLNYKKAEDLISFYGNSEL